MKSDSKYFISRNYTNKSFGGHPTLDEKIIILEDRVRGWQLDPAKQMRDTLIAGEGFENYQFALLAMLFSYFEMIGRYIDGATGFGNPGRAFKRGLGYVFPNLNKSDRTAIYRRIRCGIYHAGIVQNGATITHPIR